MKNTSFLDSHRWNQSPDSGAFEQYTDLYLPIVHHIFVHCVERPENPYEGIERALQSSRRGVHKSTAIKLSPAASRRIKNIEYSRIKELRFIFYRGVFSELNNKLSECLNRGDADVTVIYFADEGVWSEFLKNFRSRQARSFTAVNVQHGFEHRKRSRYREIRKAFNRMSVAILSYPAVGMGAFGGSGPGTFDIYLTYDDAASEFIQIFTGDKAYACPALIKSELSRDFIAARQEQPEQEARIMFALQPLVHSIFSRSYVPGGLASVCRELIPLAKATLEVTGQRLLIRKHPAMSSSEVAQAISRTGLDRWVEGDSLTRVGASLARCGCVISFDSTVLWEAGMLGLVPASLQGGCFNGSLDYPHEVVNSSCGLDQQVRSLISPATRSKYERKEVNTDFDWESSLFEYVAGHDCGNAQILTKSP